MIGPCISHDCKIFDIWRVWYFNPIQLPGGSCIVVVYVERPSITACDLNGLSLSEFFVAHMNTDQRSSFTPAIVKKISKLAFKERFWSYLEQHRTDFYLSKMTSCIGTLDFRNILQTTWPCTEADVLLLKFSVIFGNTFELKTKKFKFLEFILFFFKKDCRL